LRRGEKKGSIFMDLKRGTTSFTKKALFFEEKGEGVRHPSRYRCVTARRAVAKSEDVVLGKGRTDVYRLTDGREKKGQGLPNLPVVQGKRRDPCRCYHKKGEKGRRSAFSSRCLQDWGVGKKGGKWLEFLPDRRRF